MNKKSLTTAIVLGILVTSCANTGIGTSLEKAIMARTASSPLVSPSLPTNLPVPAYAGAQVVAVTPAGNAGATVVWSSPQAGSDILAFYENYAQRQEWQIINSTTPLIALSKEYLITIALTTDPNQGNTQIYVHYSRLAAPLIPWTTPSPALSPTPSPTPTAAVATPEAFASYLQDLTQLGILTPSPTDPQSPIPRRVYARWLVTANNRFFRDRPAAQIRLASSPQEKALFADVPTTDPDFASIQGLANAGLLDRSPTSGKILFRPNAPVTREVLVQWKMPLDIRKPVPPATVSAVQKAWEFQDSNQISPKALGAVFADARSEELSNIRRSFGFTTLLQPQKEVTYGEAAAALWYFGNGSEGISAENVIAAEKKQQE